MEIHAGIDIIDIKRFSGIFQKHGQRLLRRVYTDRELASVPEAEKLLYLCISFSFKESVWKALPEDLQGGVYFKDIEILWRDKSPEIFVKPEGNIKIVPSFSVSAGTAVTLALLL